MDMDDRRIGLRATALVAIMLLSMFVGIAAPKVEAALNPVPVLTLSLSPPQLQAKVTNAVSGSVIFSGNATVEKLSAPVERVTVSLSVTCMWPAIIDRATMVFTVSNRPQEFHVTVVVPPKTSSKEVGTLTVSGNAKAPGLALVTSSASAVITVAQFFKLSIGSDMPLKEVKPSKFTFGTINVYNEGNGLDSFELEVDNIKDLSKKEFNIIIERTAVNIDQDEYKQIKVTIQTPQKWRGYAKDFQIITIKVTSAEARNNQILYSQQYSMFVFVKGTHIPGFDPLLTILAVGMIAVSLNVRRGRSHGRRLVS